MSGIDTVTGVAERVELVPYDPSTLAPELASNQRSFLLDQDGNSTIRLRHRGQDMYFEPAGAARGEGNSYVHGRAYDPLTRESHNIVIIGDRGADMAEVMRNGQVLPVPNGMDPEAMIHRHNVGYRAGLGPDQRMMLAETDVTSPERIREAANRFGARQIPDMGLVRERQDLPRTSMGVNTPDGGEARFTPHEIGRGKYFSYVTGSLADSDGVERTVIAAVRGTSASAEAAGAAIQQGQFVHVPNNMHRDDVLQRLVVGELGNMVWHRQAQFAAPTNGATAAVAEADMNRQVLELGGDDVARFTRRRAPSATPAVEAPRSASGHVHTRNGFTALGMTVGSRGEVAASADAARESIVADAARQGHPPAGGVDAPRGGGGLVGQFNNAIRRSAPMAIAGAIITGVTALSNGASAAEAAQATGVELVEAVPGGNVITTATGVGRETNITQAYIDMGRVAAGGAMGAQMGAAAGTALLGPGPGTLAGGFIGGVAGAGLATVNIDVSALPRAVEQGHQQRMDREAFIREAAGMSAEDVRKIEDPGLRQTVTDVREALVTQMVAQGRVHDLGRDPRGNAGARNAATMALERAQNNVSDIVTMNMQERNDEGTGMGNRMMAMVQQREAERQQVMMAQVPGAETPTTQQRQPLGVGGPA